MVMKFIQFILGPNNVKHKLSNELYRFGLPVEGNSEQVQWEDSMKSAEEGGLYTRGLYNIW